MYLSLFAESSPVSRSAIFAGSNRRKGSAVDGYDPFVGHCARRDGALGGAAYSEKDYE